MSAISGRDACATPWYTIQRGPAKATPGPMTGPRAATRGRADVPAVPLD